MKSKCKKTGLAVSSALDKPEKIGLLPVDQFEKLLDEGLKCSKAFDKKFDPLYNIDDSKLNLRMK